MEIKNKSGSTLTPRLRSGFTLIELLVVISVIGLLASVILISLNSARAKARDAKRLADKRQIITALNLYYQEHASFPPTSVIDGNGPVGPVWLPPVNGAGMTVTRDWIRLSLICSHIYLSFPKTMPKAGIWHMTVWYTIPALTAMRLSSLALRLVPISSGPRKAISALRIVLRRSRRSTMTNIIIVSNFWGNDDASRQNVI